MFKDYLEEVKITRTSSTYELYGHALKNFPNGGTRNEILRFIENGDVKDTTKKLYLTILGNALDFYNKKTKDISRLITGYRCNKPVEPCPTNEEVEKVWNSLRKPRDKVIFGLMAYSGLRISEVCGLTVDDLLPDHKILLRDTKGKQDAVVPVVHPRVITAMREYLKKRHSRYKALFLSSHKEPIKLESMKMLITRHCRKCGLPYHPHSFRRYFGNTLSRAGVPVQNICVAMRHKSITTTMRYLNINQDDVRNTLERVYANAE